VRRIRVRVTGLVQGVGYRVTTARAAEAQGVTGWVRNRGDGTVEAELEGDVDALEAVLARMRRGPAGARVDGLSVDELPPAGDTGFEVRPTA